MPFFPDVHDQLVKTWSAPQSARVHSATQAMFSQVDTSPEAVNDLRAATDFALMATKFAAQAIGRTMGFMVVQQRHIWLTLANLKDADRKVL